MAGNRGVSVGARGREFPHKARVTTGDVAFSTGVFSVRYLGPGGAGDLYGFAVERRDIGGKGDLDPEVTTANLTAVVGETMMLPWVKDGITPLMLTVEGQSGVEPHAVKVSVTTASPKLTALLDKAVDFAGEEARRFIQASAGSVGVEIEPKKAEAIGDALAAGATVDGDGVQAGNGPPPPRRRKKDRPQQPHPAVAQPQAQDDDCGDPACRACGRTRPGNPRFKDDGSVRVTIPRHILRIMRMALGKLGADAAQDVFSADRTASNIGIVPTGQDMLPRVMQAVADSTEFLPLN